jgi:proteic killer suppression protein
MTQSTERLLAVRGLNFTVLLNGPLCITFEFDKGDAANIDFEQYH